MAKTILQRRGKCCASCGFYDIADALDKAGRVKRESTALCDWRGDLPDSMRNKRFESYVAKRYMGPEEGANCPCWEQREEGEPK